MFSKKKMKLGFAVLFLSVIATIASAGEFYLEPEGQDGNGNDGSPEKPWKTLSYAFLQTAPGDTIHLKANAVFSESVYVAPMTGGTANNPKTVVSDPNNPAKITPPDINNLALYVDSTGGLRFENIHFVGQGMDIHNTSGVMVYSEEGCYTNIQFRNCSFSGFGGSGLSIGSWANGPVGFSHVLITDCTAEDNRCDGITIWGKTEKAHSNVVIRDCISRRNLGDPNYTSGHTGSGIILGATTDGLIEHCIAYENGARCITSGGPVGIWCYLCEKVTIQYCEAYSNRAVNCDGGGFDIDGGAQNSTIQYCYSHDNEGGGYLICQYTGATRASVSNTVRFCISERDGRKRTGGFHFWSSGSADGLKESLVYGNTIFTSNKPSVYFQNITGQSGTKFWNNIFVRTNGTELVSGNPVLATANFQNNVYWTFGGTIKVGAYNSLEEWRNGLGQEMLDSAKVGYNLDPELAAPGTGGIIGDTHKLNTLTAYKLRPHSPMVNRGLNILSLFGVASGSLDFYGNAVPSCREYDIGAYEAPDTDDDGISDDWEMYHWGNLHTANTYSDADKDGQSDFDEFVAGTDPRNANSLLTITSVATDVAENKVTLSWPSVTGRFYSIAQTSDLLLEKLQVVRDSISATAPSNTYILPIVNSKAFYAVYVQ